MGVLGHLPHQRLAVLLGHPVLGLDADALVDARLERSFLFGRILPGGLALCPGINELRWFDGDVGSSEVGIEQPECDIERGPVVLLGSFGALQVGVKTSQIVINDDVYESAAFIEGHAADSDLQYPENYVLSDWGRNRVYNYFANGESASYDYAFQHYREFAGGTDPDAWYDRFEDRVGYIVLSTAPEDTDPRFAISQLTQSYGSADGGVPGVGHYRVLYVTDGGSKTIVSVVPGANLTGSGEAGDRVAVSTRVVRESVQFPYER
jgi:hypothetical protein